MALSKDIREKVVKAIKGGMSRRQAAARFDVGPATAVRWAKRVETTGDVSPMKMSGDLHHLPGLGFRHWRGGFR
jgi:transposase